jgi:glycosyltransferase involved in cell wall biosynthesis
MAEAPLFSVVTITYGNLEGLQKTVSSVRSQSFRDFEHLIIDGGSHDGTVEWLAAEFDGLWVSEPDRGRYDAMNKGARRSNGRYLWFLHAGDCFGDSVVLARVADAVRTDPEWAYGMARVVNPDKSLKGVLGFLPFSRFKFAVLGHPLPHQATVFRRDFFWKLGGHDERFPIAADQLLMLRATDVTAPAIVADFLCDFDATGISADRPWWRDFLDGERVRREVDHSVTPWRALDAGISLGYTLLRQVARAARQCGS